MSAGCFEARGDRSDRASSASVRPSECASPGASHRARVGRTPERLIDPRPAVPPCEARPWRESGREDGRGDVAHARESDLAASPVDRGHGDGRTPGPPECLVRGPDDLGRPPGRPKRRSAPMRGPGRLGGARSVPQAVGHHHQGQRPGRAPRPPARRRRIPRSPSTGRQTAPEVEPAAGVGLAREEWGGTGRAGPCPAPVRGLDLHRIGRALDTAPRPLPAVPPVE